MAGYSADSRIVLYEADRYKTRYNNAKWTFEPAPFERLAWLLEFLLHEHPVEDREARVTALLAGEVVCTNLSAFRLVMRNTENSKD